MPDDAILSVTMKDVIKILSQRLDVSTLSTEDLELVRHEVQTVIDHHLDIREYIEIGLDIWAISRTL